ncbi:hypothetical protein AC578_1256 [Neofusicoccum parvum]|uniref:Uncharacterized protein n=1 Tax=Neofusicoccum parvum TaxID=310453 RepID=A0ACB5SII8_9PEZI|nr:hypothetical protein AC578_1256 [Neofusicoccum parvum]
MSTCYYPDGTVSDDVPCDSAAANSACCSSGAYCLGNGLCLADGLTSRGSCTDESWDDEACTQYCRDSNPSGSTPLRLCDINGASPNSFSCGASLDNCASGINTFTLTSNIMIPLSDFTSSSAGSNVLAARAASSNSPSADGSQNGTMDCGGRGGGGGNDGYTGAELAGVGIGVGVPFAAAFFLTLILLAREKKRNKLLTAGGVAGYDPLKQGDGAAAADQVYVQQTPQYPRDQQQQQQ